MEANNATPLYSRIKALIGYIKDQFMETCEISKFSSEDLAEYKFACAQADWDLTDDQIKTCYNLAAHSAIESLILNEYDYEQDEEQLKTNIALLEARREVLK